SEASGELFDIKFQELVASLESKMLLNLGFEIDAKINNKIFYFPKQFMRLGYQLQELTSILCDTEYYQSCHLRGLYFTSLFQNEAEYDLITHKAQKASGFKDFQDRKAYFIDKFVPAILLTESDYCGFNQKYIKDQATMAKLKSLGIGTSTTALIILWVSSYVSNQSYTREVAQETHEYEISHRQMKPSEILNTLYNISMIEKQMSNRWLLSTGLYKHNDINAMTQKLYSKAIEHYYLPELLSEIKQQLETSLKNASNQDDAFSKQALSVYAVSTWLTIYLMFNQPGRMNDEYVKENLEVLWQTKMAVNSDEYGQNIHALKHILEFGVEPQQIDEALVEQARKSLRGSKDAYIQAYLNLKKDALADKKSYLNLNNRGTLGFDQVFSISGGDAQIPMLYTKEGYASIFLKEEVSYIKTILNQQWVVNGDKNNDGPELSQVKKGMEALYWNDYLLYWNTTLARVHVNQFSSLQEASQILNLLTSKDNPIKDVFKLISFNTNFALSSVLSKLKSDDEGTSSKLKEVLLSTNNIVTNQYASFIQMTDDGSGLQQIQQLLTPVRDGLSELLTQIDQSKAAYQESVAVFNNGGKLATSISNLWQAAQSMPQHAKNILQQLVQNLYRVLFTSAHQYVLDNWENQVQSIYNRTLANSYPFISSSGNIATVPDFVNFFKKSGVEHSFAEKYLDPLLQTDAQGIQQWAVARNIAFMPDNALLKNIQQSNAIRKLMFSNSNGDGFTVTLKPTYLGEKVDVFTIKYNDKIISYANGPQLNEVISWPPTIENDGNVLLTFHLSDGTVVNQQYDGKWALFKAMSAAKIINTPQNGVYSVEFKHNDLSAKFDLQTTSIGNPFDMSNIQGYQLETQKK
ncbi:type VI secretion system membrane subunit TssM, partial [Francisellaceae bacterium]|nr:type VI secretion system membrane subunit TssM [Francisellaceae bacterium]